jgi:hypothetical protein
MPTDDTPVDLPGGAAAADGAAMGDPGTDRHIAGAERPHGRTAAPQQVTSRLLQGLRSRLPVLALAGTDLLIRARSRARPPAEAGTDPGGQPLSRPWRCSKWLNSPSDG